VLLRAYGFLGLVEAALALVAFSLVWRSYGFSLSDVQRITPLLLSHTADPDLMIIYRQATTATLAAIVMALAAFVTRFVLRILKIK
jgi:Ca2+-transporting ATPase